MIYRCFFRAAAVLLMTAGAHTLFGAAPAEREAATRTVTHSLGTIEVPESVERVVTLEWSYTVDVLSLGLQPVGAADIEGYRAWVDIPAALDEAAVDVGRRQEPNLERIIALEPDLIITSSLRAANNYDELNAIAPTLMFDGYPQDGSSQYAAMLDNFRVIADALDRKEAGEAVIKELEMTFERAKAGLRESGPDGDRFVLAVSYISGDAPVFRLFTDNAMAVEVIERIGLSNVWKGPPGKYGFSKVDFEGLGSIGGDSGAAAGADDLNFLYIAQPDARDTITAAPVWDSLSFVQSGNVYWLGGDVWLSGGPMSAAVLVKAISTALGAGF